MSRGWHTHAVVIEGPERLSVDQLALQLPSEDDVVVDVEWSGISSGTERLLWFGRMPGFPGMGYPLVPGYESVGRIAAAGSAALERRIGERVFVPGARCFGEIRGLFGGAASRLVVPAARVTRVDEALGERAILLAGGAPLTAEALLLPGDLAPVRPAHGEGLALDHAGVREQIGCELRGFLFLEAEVRHTRDRVVLGRILQVFHERGGMPLVGDVSHRHAVLRVLAFEVRTLVAGDAVLGQDWPDLAAEVDRLSGAEGSDENAKK